MKARENVLESFRSLVNNPEYSDVQLITSDGQKLFAHKNILSLRCPQFIKVKGEFHPIWNLHRVLPTHRIL